MNHIVIIGFMGSGKTRVGKRLAKDLGLPFIDVDRLIVKKMNMSVKEVFDALESRFIVHWRQWQLKSCLQMVSVR